MLSFIGCFKSEVTIQQKYKLVVAHFRNVLTTDY